MALQMRHMGRQITWSNAVRTFVLRYAVVNAYATCRSLGVARTGTMFDWQWDLIRRRFCTVAVAKPIHVPVRMPGRRVCAHCDPGQDPLRLLWVRQVVPCGVLCRGTWGDRGGRGGCGGGGRRGRGGWKREGGE